MVAIIRQPNFILATALLLTPALPASAAVTAWKSTTDGSWNVGSNWTAGAVPGILDDASLGSIAGTEGVTTTLDANSSVESLTMTNGNDLDTDRSRLIVNGQTSISGSGTRILLGGFIGLGDHRSLDTDSMDISNSGELRLLGGLLEVDGDTGDGRLALRSGGTVYGYGTINLNDSGAGPKLTLNNGNLKAGYIGSTFGDHAGTLHINATDPGATLDMDQGISTITVFPSGTLDINVPLADPYSDTIELRRNATLDIADSWEFDGSLDVSTGPGGLPGQNAGPATVTGATWTMQDGTITLDDADDHLIIDAALNATGGIIDHDAGTLEFNSESTIGSGVDFKVGNTTELIVNSRLTVNDADWDWDGDGELDNVITIRAPGRLVAMLDAPGTDDIWSGLMHLDGGSLWVGGSDDTWGTNGRILVEGSALSTIEGGTMTQLGNSARLEVAGTASLDMLAPNIWEGGVFQIDGSAYLKNDTTWAGTTVSGSGTLFQNDGASVIEDTTIGVDTYTMNASTNINPGLSLTINSTHFSVGATAVANGLSVRSGGTLTVAADWELDDLTQITLDGGGGVGSTLAEGGTLTVKSGGLISIQDRGNKIDTDVVLEEGADISVTHGGSVVLGDLDTGNDTITLAGGDITEMDPDCLVANKSTLVVTGDSKIKVTTFDWDSGPTIIEAGGILNIEVESIDDTSPKNRYDSATLRLQGGSLNVDNSENLWVMNARTYISGGSSILGDTMQIGADNGGSKGNLTVRAPGTANITAPLVFASDANVVIDENAILCTQTTTFESVNGTGNASFSGAGTWLLAGHNHINEPTIIHMEGGTLDFDNSAGGSVTPHNTDIDADLTVYAKSLDDYGFYGFSPSGPIYSHMNIAEGRQLDVHLDNPADFWTVNSQGVVNYNGGTPVSTFLAGADVHMDGTLNVTGQGHCGVKMAISGTVNIKDAGGNLKLDGGTNIFGGGTIHGPGTLTADSHTSIVGYGMIDADIAFPGSAGLYADNGVLRITGNILDAYYVGTDGDDGILEVANDWSTETSGASVRMKGGELRGATLTVGASTDIFGHGLVSARVINNGLIQTSSRGETLVLQTAGNDNLWDGSTKRGDLRAIYYATLELRDTGDYPFSGSITIDQGGTVFLNGFRMTLGSGSKLDLAGGALQYSGGPAMEIMGSVLVASGLGNSQIKTQGSPGGFLFKAGASVGLNGNLELNAETVVIEKDVTFSGSGVLMNQPGSTLQLGDGASLTGTLENRGDLVIGSSPGHVVGENFTQLADGTLHIEIAGMDTADRDTLRFSGDTRLAGTLDLSLLNGFVPSLGQTCFFLGAAAISGTFDNVIQPPTMPEGLKFEVNYAPSEVSLTVVSDGDAYGEWIDTFASLSDPADKLKTADPDGDGMDNLAEFALDGDPTNPAASGKIVGKIAPAGGADAMTLTFPMRVGATPAAGDPAGGELVFKQDTDGVTYTIQASNDLDAFTLTVAEVVGADAAAIQAGLPPLGAGWTYRTFRCPGPVPGDSGEFMRVRISAISE